MPEDVDEYSPLPIWKNVERWNMHTALARLIADGLETFAEKQHGYPAPLTEDQWMAILQQMIDGFKLVRKHETEGLDDEEIEQVNRALELFKEWFWDLWD